MARIAFLSWSNGRFDARTQRMAATARAAGHDVVVYARWERGLPRREEIDGVEVVRAAPSLWSLVPLVGRRRRARTEHNLMRFARATLAGAPIEKPIRTPRAERFPAPLRPPARTATRWISQLLIFPLRPLAWARAVEDVAEPADLWHGMWGGSLPASLRLRRRHGGRAIYDARDVLLESRAFVRLPWLLRAVLARLERRWAHKVDAVLSVNGAYADILTANLGIERPVVVMNCPVRFQPPDPRPDLVRDALGLEPATAIVLYQGLFMTERGIEQSMAAILDVPGTVLALLGFGSLKAWLDEAIAGPPYAGRVFVLDPVPPRELLPWTASADVSIMAIQPTTLNHRYTTPQKLFESLAAGTPIVAADLPGMAPIVRASGAGVVCDPTDPAAIAAAIRSILELDPDERAAIQARALAAAHDTYNWDSQEVPLRATWDRLLAGGR